VREPECENKMSTGNVDMPNWLRLVNTRTAVSMLLSISSAPIATAVLDPFESGTGVPPVNHMQDAHRTSPFLLNATFHV
jgi:hypothetical protein